MICNILSIENTSHLATRPIVRKPKTERRAALNAQPGAFSGRFTHNHDKTCAPEGRKTD